MNKKYLALNNEAPRLRLISMLWTATAIKVFDLPEWTWGVFGVLYTILIISALVKIFTYEKVEL